MLVGRGKQHNWCLIPLEHSSEFDKKREKPTVFEMTPIKLDSVIIRQFLGLECGIVPDSSLLILP